jgi:F-box associated protein
MMSLIRDSFKRYSLQQMYEYLNNIILFEDDISKVHYELKNITAITEHDMNLRDKIFSRLALFHQQKKLYLSRREDNTVIKDYHFSMEFPPEILFKIFFFMPINQRLTFRLVNQYFREIADNTRLNELVIFPASLSAFKGFIQTGINKSGYRKKNGALTIGNLLLLLSNLDEEDKNKLAKIAGRHAFAISQNELYSHVDINYCHRLYNSKRCQ